MVTKLKHKFQNIQIITPLKTINIAFFCRMENTLEKLKEHGFVISKHATIWRPLLDNRKYSFNGSEYWLIPQIGDSKRPNLFVSKGGVGVESIWAIYLNGDTLKILLHTEHYTLNTLEFVGDRINIKITNLEGEEFLLQELPQ